MSSRSVFEYKIHVWIVVVTDWSVNKREQSKKESNEKETCKTIKNQSKNYLWTSALHSRTQYHERTFLA